MEKKKIPKVKRKMWINCLRGLGLHDIMQYAKEHDLEILKGFKPDMMVDIHLGIKGTKDNIDTFKVWVKANGHEYKTRCPRRSFQFTI